jgi:hypothetical protein
MTARHLPLLLAGLAPLHAAESAGRWFDHAIERAWIQSYDPTLVTRHALSLALELPLDSENFDSKLTAGLAWYF